MHNKLILIVFFNLNFLIGNSFAQNAIIKLDSMRIENPLQYFKKLEFSKYKKPTKKFIPDTSISYSISIYRENLYEAGIIYGKMLGADSNYYFIETDQIYNNCYFDNIPYKSLGYNKFIASINKNYLLEINAPSKYKASNSISEVTAWASVVTILFSPLICIDFKKGKFLENRYFGINRIALPLFVTSVSIYLITNFRTIRINRGNNVDARNLYYPVE
jgi:hypothetical protein